MPDQVPFSDWLVLDLKSLFSRCVSGIMHPLAKSEGSELSLSLAAFMQIDLKLCIKN